MPKERIRTERIQHHSATVHDGTNCACSNEIVISWGKADGAALLGVAQLDATPGDHTQSHYTDLDHEAIGRLIKVLRKAQRQIMKA